MPETLQNCDVYLARYKALIESNAVKKKNRNTELHTEQLLTCSNCILKYNRYSQERINFHQHTGLATQLK